MKKFPTIYFDIVKQKELKKTKKQNKKNLSLSQRDLKKNLSLSFFWK